MRIFSILIISVGLAMTGFAAAQEADNSAMAVSQDSDEMAIRSVITAYFDGIGGADAALLNKAFAARHATMVGLVKNDDGSRALTTARDMEKTLWRWSANGQPEGKGRDGEILDMHIEDGKIAMVMFRYKDEYYDVLSLL